MIKKRKRMAAWCLAGGLAVLQMTGCGSSGQSAVSDSKAEESTATESAAGESTVEESNAASEETGGKALEVSAALGEGQEMSVIYEAEDLDMTWLETDSVVIACEDGEPRISGDGASWQDGVLTISKAGTYVLSGTLAEGRIVVDAGKEDIVRLVLNGFEIHSSVTSPIYGARSGKIVLILADGTENMVSDAESYTWEAEEGEPNAAVFSGDDLVIGGTGSLAVTGNYECGIRSKDDLTVVSGDIFITAKTDGIKGKDSVKIKGGTIQIVSGDDGIQSNNHEDADKGYIWIDGGIITIQSVGKAVTAETRAVINGGEITVTGCSEGVEGKTVDINGGILNITASDDGLNAAAAVETEREKMMDQEGVYIRIAGGMLRIDAAADGIDSNGDLYMEGGELYLSGPEGNRDGLLDYNGKASVSGGTFFGTGSAGMAQTFGTDSTQNSLVVYYTAQQSAGTKVELLDESGTVLGSYAPEKAFEMAIISMPEILTGSTYMVKTGEETVEMTVEGVLTIYGTASGRKGMDGGRGMGGRGEGGGRPERDMTPPSDGQMPKGTPPALPEGVSGEEPEGGPPPQAQ